MKFYFYLVIFHVLFLLLLIACNSPTQPIYNRYEEFPATKNLTAEIIPLDTVLFYYPFRIAVRENVAIVQDLHNIDNYLHAFSFPDWKHIQSFVPRGEGPEEMIICETFQFDSLDSLWVLEPNRLILHRYEIDSMKSTISLVEQLYLDKNILCAVDIVVNSNSFIIPDYTGDYRFHVLNKKGQIIQSTGRIPKETQKRINIALAQGWRPFIDYNETTGYLSMVTQLGEVLEIYNLKDSTHIVKYGPNGEPKFQEIQGQGLPSGIMGFVDIQVTDNYIYAVFEGSSFKEHYIEYTKGNNPPSGGNRIYVFDMEGNPVRQYLLDHFIMSIDVHEEEGVIYALDVNQDQPVLKFAF